MTLIEKRELVREVLLLRAANKSLEIDAKHRLQMWLKFYNRSIDLHNELVTLLAIKSSTVTVDGKITGLMRRQK